MATRVCKNGHTFEKTSSCPVCPICSSNEMNKKYGSEFPKIGAPAFRALDSAGIKKLSQLTVWSEQELLSLHGMGPKAVGILHEALQAQGMSFKE